MMRTHAAPAADDRPRPPRPRAPTPLWPTVVVKALFDPSTNADGIAASLERRLPGTPTPRVEVVADKAWEREWLRDFGPMRFGHRLWVCPGGMPAGDADAIRIELDPGLAFGTGTHPTTALCLEWLDSQPLEGATVVDYGCGSGILAIAAARLGARRVRAVDIDPQALIATVENAARNGAGDIIDATGDPLLAPGGADVLVANILAGPLVELAPRFAEAVAPGGRIALSGLLREQADAVTAAYRPCFHIDPARERAGWVLLAGHRRAHPR